MKKHDKLSPLRLREAFATLVTVQPFYTSTQLAATFTHAQCIQAELLSAAFGAPPLPPPTHPPTPLPRQLTMALLDTYSGSTYYGRRDHGPGECRLLVFHLHGGE